MRSLFTPSTLLPSFLQSEFKIGTPQENFLVTSIDEGFTEFRSNLFEKFFSFHRNFYKTPEKRKHLERMGFKTQSLSPNEIVLFYDNAEILLKNIEKMDSVYFLSQLYFFGSKVERGRNLSAMKINPQRLNFQIPEKDHKNQVLIIKLPGLLSLFEARRVEELVNNCQELVPPFFKILVRGNSEKKEERRLSFPFQIAGGEECPISLN